jgi:hypothetical protein
MEYWKTLKQKFAARAMNERGRNLDLPARVSGAAQRPRP